MVITNENGDDSRFFCTENDSTRNALIKLQAECLRPSDQFNRHQFNAFVAYTDV